jgi:hypothetical protein
MHADIRDMPLAVTIAWQISKLIGSPTASTATSTPLLLVKAITFSTAFPSLLLMRQLRGEALCY